MRHNPHHEQGCRRYEKERERSHIETLTDSSVCRYHLLPRFAATLDDGQTAILTPEQIVMGLNVCGDFATEMISDVFYS